MVYNPARDAIRHPDDMPLGRSTRMQDVLPQLRALLQLPAIGALVNGYNALRRIANEGEQRGVFGFPGFMASSLRWSLV